MTGQVLEELTPGRLQALSPQLRKAARFVVEHPAEVATRSQRHVANRANLPAPTFTRLAQAIGYDGYDALRDICRRDLLNAQTVLAQKAQALVDSGDSSFAARHVAATMRNSEALIAELNQDKLDAAVGLLAGARRVVLIGVMSARPLVDYAMYLANMSLSGWSVPGCNGYGLAADLADLGAGDVGIVMSIAPYAAQAIELAETIAEAGVPIIALTDNRLSPVTGVARHSFCIGADSPLFFPSHVAGMVFFEAIIGMIIQTRGKEAQERIAAVERQNHKLGEYWQEKPASNKGDMKHETPD